MIDALLNIRRPELYKRLFALRAFDFVTVKDGKKHEKQELALRCLTDNEIKETGYGGAAGGAKSWTGCVWLAFMCLLYPGTRWFIGRRELKRLRESTLMTWYKVCKAYDIVKDEDWKYNGQDHYIAFSNGSRIDLLELKSMPSDPMFERYGSIEYTGGWIEEAGEVAQAAYDTLKSRCGRQLNDRYGLRPKVYVTFNPKKNFVYTYFYKRDKEGRLPKHIVFIKALLYDNPHRERDYEAQLKELTSKAQKERLLHGNFDYEDDPAVLCDYDAITDVFVNEHVGASLSAGDRYISADLAMQGRDRFVAGLWSGFVCDLTAGIDRSKSTGREIEEDLKQLMIKGRVPRSKTIADSDGLGAYLVSYLEGIKEFRAGAAAVNAEFANIKSECAYKLAELINKRELRIICSAEQRERITEELCLLKAEDADRDEGKKRIIKKEVMKDLLGRSPDYLDMLLMRMWFVVQGKGYRIYYL